MDKERNNKEGLRVTEGQNEREVKREKERGEKLDQR